ncbi:MAG: transporter, partial [Halioglobus sp.]|nr:transporter [Halioglobus sp.]
MNVRINACAALLAACAAAQADMRPDAHAPISVMGDHMHEMGEVMFSYRYMHMSMRDNADGTSRISPEKIVTTVPNRFANPPMMPPTLRVVPTKMTMDMHMLGAMYAPTDRLTLMGMANYQKKDMTHITFAGPMGTTRLGKFRTSTSGLGDTVLSAMYSVVEPGPTHRWHVTLGLSLPTGDIDEEDRVLTPMNTQPTVRVPYPMQMGSGTYDLVSGLTYASNADLWGWGAQVGAVTRLGDNDK